MEYLTAVFVKNNIIIMKQIKKLFVVLKNYILINIKYG